MIVRGEWGEVVKKSFHDRFVTVCFTMEGAEGFIKAEGHNLTNPRVYVGHVGRRNVELRGVLGLLGDD